MDAFAVSVAAGACGQAEARTDGLRMAGAFGLFQGAMPIAGWLIGAQLAGWIGDYDHWVAFGLLALIGVRMIRSGASSAPVERRADPSRGWVLLALAVATSIDAWVTGMGLAMLDVSIWIPSLVIALVTVTLSWIGVVAGCRLGVLVGRRMEIVGGAILILIGARVLLIHLIG
ncbi:MAG: manganese efflux pump [Candidatus Eisenbacteria bacterium]|nr:manganese efflux pump [Candidatus Eisenbacteria bacterium]